MARRKQEVQLQQELESQEEWEEMLSKEGLTVIDVYQEWAGPCNAMVSNLRRVKNELGDDLLKFAVAKADTIDALEKYRGRCEPCFLYVASGMLVSVVRGANSPLVLRTITEQLAQEHKVLDGNAERKEIRDPLMSEMDSADRSDEDEDEEREEDEEKKKEVTVAIIKPDAVKAGKTVEIMEQMQSAGIEILANEERQLTDEEAREFYSHLQGEEFYEDLINFMISGPCHVLVLTKGTTGENVIEEWRHLIGPTSVEEAKESAPESLRAKFGSEKFMNALHGSDSPDRASRELAFFFPNFNVPTVPGSVKLQRTLALIRPDAFKNSKDEILEKIRESGFRVALQKVVQLSKDQAEEFYKEHEGQEYFAELTTRMSSGPLLALGLAREDAVGAWRTMLGPKDVSQAKEEAPECLRAQYSVDETPINQLHGSDSEETAQKELEFFFPMQQTVAVIKPDAYGTKDEIVDKIHEAGFRIAARKETQLTKDIAEQLYADQKGKEYYDDLVEHMVSGKTYFMVLSREDAVEGWRSLLGPTDPEKAKAEAPDTIRALYGTDIKQNAVHGSSDPDKAKQSIQTIFGDLEFNPDGTVKVEKLQQAATEQEQGEQSTEQTQESAETQQEESQPETQQQEDTQPQQQQQEDSQPAQEESQGEESSEDKKEEQTTEEESKPEEQDTEQADSKPEGETTGDGAKPEVAQEGGETKPETEKPSEGEQQIEQQEEATEQQASEQQPVTEQQQTTEQQPETEQQATTDQQGSTEQQPETEQRTSEQQPETEQPTSEQQPETEQPTSEQQAVSEQQPTAEQQATTEQQAATESTPTNESQQAAEQEQSDKPEQKEGEEGAKSPSPTQGEEQSTGEPQTTETVDSGDTQGETTPEEGAKKDEEKKEGETEQKEAD